MGGFPPRRWGRARVEAFSVEPHAVQVTWVGLPPGPVRVRLDGRDSAVETDGGPGGRLIDGLEPGARYAVRVDAGDHATTVEVRTPTAPGGAPLSQVATVSDVHVGAVHFGASSRMRESDDHHGDPHPIRCGRAAIADAATWGADLLVVKGDLVELGRPHEWVAADELLSGTATPLAFVPGNHEVKAAREMDPPIPLPLSGVHMVTGVEHVDLPGLRVVLVNSTVDGHGHGEVLHRAEEVADLASDADGQVLVTMHQHAQRFAAPWFWPPGIRGSDARAFLDILDRAAPGALVTSGHSHRNRARRHGSLTVTEVGSTKDFPGVWAGYTAYEDGLVQVVRRTLDPSAMEWSEYTRRAVLGVWGRWAPGSVGDRCVVTARR
ncbi:MAG: metallophosphoesterase [Acidimicrobiales bacterium]